MQLNSILEHFEPQNFVWWQKLLTAIKRPDLADSMLHPHPGGAGSQTAAGGTETTQLSLTSSINAAEPE